MDIVNNEAWNRQGFYYGYATNHEDLEFVRDIVKTHFLAQLKTDYPTVHEFAEVKAMDEYHTYCEAISHGEYWQKRRRILPSDQLLRFKSSDLYNWLAQNLAIERITGEDGVYEEEVYWRLVRPNQQKDVGPLHADAWFWEISGSVIPSGFKRVKVWIPLFTEPGESGFCYIPGSHLENTHYEKQYRDYKWKPQISEDLNYRKIVFRGTPGTPIIFHDRLIHGGNAGGTKTRVSLEFTALVRQTNDF